MQACANTSAVFFVQMLIEPQSRRGTSRFKPHSLSRGCHSSHVATLCNVGQSAREGSHANAVPYPCSLSRAYGSPPLPLAMSANSCAVLSCFSDWAVRARARTQRTPVSRSKLAREKRHATVWLGLECGCGANVLGRELLAGQAAGQRSGNNARNAALRVPAADNRLARMRGAMQGARPGDS